MFHSPATARLKWLTIWLLVLSMFTTAFAPGGLNSANLTNVTPGSGTFIRAINGDARTLDPALEYDTISGEVVQNIYETLVFYDGAKASEFVPHLASSYQLSGDGLTWTFHIRPGVKFHNGASLTASDVAYSFQRGILQGGTSSPQWLLTEPFLGMGIDDISLLMDPSGNLYDDRAALVSWWNPAQRAAACLQVKEAIVANDVAGTVTMHLAQPWSPFLATIAGTWGSIMDKDWTVANGGWDGSCNTWQYWYAMTAGEDPFTSLTNGTGPFKLDHWTPGQEIVMVRNNNYWRTPAQLNQIAIRIVPDDSTRFAMLQNGSADEAQPVGNLGVAETLVGEDCVWNVSTSNYDCTNINSAKFLRRYTDRPSIAQHHVLLNFDISNPPSGNPYIGSAALDGTGIPTDFFSDVHIRKAFNYCFDWDILNEMVYGGAFVQGTTLVLDGMPGYDLNAPHYSFNLEACETELGLADLDHDGILSKNDTNDVTQVGFHLRLPYNDGNFFRQSVMSILAASFAQAGSKYVINTVKLPWEDYINAQSSNILPIMTGGWVEDIHDPHNWYVPYLIGTYANRAHISDVLQYQYGILIDQGVSAANFSARHTIYQQLNQLVYDTAPLIIVGSTTNHDFIQRGVTGQVHNQAFPGNYYYPISKVQAFDDVAPAYWSWSYIERLYAAGITGGCSTSPLMYCPGSGVTRDQMAVFLLKGKHGSNYVPPAATGMFADVPQNYWAAAWIEQLAREGITSGCSVSPAQYCPGSAVTRDQMAVFLLKAKHGSGYVPPAATGDFADVPLNHWAAAWIEQLAVEGITGGCSVTPNQYCPGSPVTRDQMAVFLVRNFNLP
jgi:peptide/nickel transport system substrate-binding protein